MKIKNTIIALSSVLLCLCFTGCETPNIFEHETEMYDSTMMVAEQTKTTSSTTTTTYLYSPPQYEQTETATSTTQLYTSPQHEQTTTKVYTHYAICGAVITGEDSKSGSFTYRRKCESCGYVDSSTCTSYQNTGTFSNTFYCPKCKNRQKIEIECSSTSY